MSKKCKLCGKTFNNNNYQLFGKSCFKEICELLDIVIPRNIKEKDKERYLCSSIAKKLNKKGLTIKQKQYLTELYIVTLYNLYNATDMFRNKLTEMEEMHIDGEISENIKNDKKAIQYFQYIFKVKKILNPKEYALSYYRQYIFWETVINGGLLFNYKLAAKLLKHSLSEVGDEPRTYNVTDKKIIEDIKNDEDFIEKLDEIIKKYSNEQYFKTEAEGEKETFAFENNTDFKFAIHNADIIVEGNKNKENYWDLNIDILDRFDFTDFIFPEEYNDKYKEINKNENKTAQQKVVSSVKNGLGYTLNNIALASVQYGVLKEYDVKISFSMHNYGKKGD